MILIEFDVKLTSNKAFKALLVNSEVGGWRKCKELSQHYVLNESGPNPALYTATPSLKLNHC